MLIKALGNSVKWFATYGFRIYLSKPNFSQNITNESGVTLILENEVDRQADRPAVWNRVVDCNGTMTFTFGSITGTLYGYVYNTTSWGVVDISSYLSGLVLTLPNNWKVKYFYDDNYTYYCEQGQGTTVVDNAGAGASITISTSALWNTDDTIPYEANWGDINGIIESDQGEYPISYGTGSLTGTTIWYGRKDEPLYINDIPHISLDEGLGDTLSIDVGTFNLSLVTITEVRGVRHGTTTKLVPSDFNINASTNEIEVSTGLTVDVNYFKFSDNTEATYMGGRDASGNVIGSTNFRINSSVGAGTFTVNVADVDASTVLVDGGFAPGVEWGFTSNRISINASDYTSGDFTLASTLAGAYRYRDAFNYINFGVTRNSDGSTYIDPTLSLASGLHSDFFLYATNYSFNESQKYFYVAGYLGAPGFKNNEWSITLESNANFKISIRDNLYLRLQAYINSRPDPYTDRVLSSGYTTFDSLKTWYDNNVSEQAGLDEFFNQIEAGLTFGNFYQYFIDNSISTTSLTVIYIGILFYTVTHNGSAITYSGTNILVNAAVSTGLFATGARYWTDNNSKLVNIDSFLIEARAAGYCKITGGSIKEFEKIPCLTDGSNIGCRYGYAADNPSGNHLDLSTKVALPPQRTITEQEMGNLTGAFDFHRDKGGDTYDRLLIAAYDDTALTTAQTNKATNYTT